MTLWITCSSSQGCQVCVFFPTSNIICSTSNNRKKICALLLLIRIKVSVFKFCPFYHEIQTINGLFNALKCDVSDRCNASVQAAARSASLFFLFNTSYISKNMNEYQRYVERYSLVQLTRIYHVSCNHFICVSTAERRQ